MVALSPSKITSIVWGIPSGAKIVAAREQVAEMAERFDSGEQRFAGWFDGM